MVTQCCVCGKIRVDDEKNIWGYTPIDPKSLISHGYCPPCADKEVKKIKRRRKRDGV